MIGVNIMSAIFSGRTGFIKATQQQAARAHSIANASHDEKEHSKLAENLVGLKLDQNQAKANLKTFRIGDELLRELMRLGK